LKKAVTFAMLMFLLLLQGCAKRDASATGDLAIQHDSQSSPTKEPGPFVPEDIENATSGFRTVADWVKAAGRRMSYVKTQESDGLTRICLGETDSSVVITVLVPDNDFIVDDAGDSRRASDGYYETLPDKLLSLPIERLEFLRFDWLGLPLPRGGKIGDTIEDIQTQYLHTGSHYDPSLLYDISAIYPGTDPAEGDYGIDVNGNRTIVGGYHTYEPSTNPSIMDANYIDYLWASSPNRGDWKEYCTLTYYFDVDGILYECDYVHYTDPQ